MEAEVAPEVEALLGREALAELDFEALEVALRQRTLRLAAHAIEQRLNADLSDQASTRLGCPCGQEARYVARRTKNFVSVLGPLRLERAYYHCSRCSHGFYPRDQPYGDRKHLPVSGTHTHDWHRGGHGQLSGRQ